LLSARPADNDPDFRSRSWRKNSGRKFSGAFTVAKLYGKNRAHHRITGQDGSYLAELLLERATQSTELSGGRAICSGHDRASPKRRQHYGKSLLSSLWRFVGRHDVAPDFFGSATGGDLSSRRQSHVGLSFEIPESTCEEIGMGTLGLLEIARDQPQALKFYHASSSEIFWKRGGVAAD